MNSLRQAKEDCDIFLTEKINVEFGYTGPALNSKSHRKEEEYGQDNVKIDDVFESASKKIKVIGKEEEI